MLQLFPSSVLRTLKPPSNRQDMVNQLYSNVKKCFKVPSNQPHLIPHPPDTQGPSHHVHGYKVIC